MATTNIVIAPFGGSRIVTVRPLYQYDYGQVLQFAGLTLPTAYEVHFSSEENGTAITHIGGADGVAIPDSLLEKHGTIYAWVFLHNTGTDGETRYTAKIPVRARSAAEMSQPTPTQKDAITEAIAALNAAVDSTGRDAESASASAESAAQSAADAETSAERAEQAAGESGWMYFEIVGGYLWLERTPNTNLDFYLDNGDLWMEAIE